MTKKVHIFSNGSQYGDWKESNCVRCKKSSYHDPEDDGTKFPLDCDIESALMLAYVGDGMVTEEIRQRSGCEPGHYSWRCTEAEWVGDEIY